MAAEAVARHNAKARVFKKKGSGNTQGNGGEGRQWKHTRQRWCLTVVANGGLVEPEGQ